MSLPKSINVLSELERYGLDYRFSGEDEVLCRCPFHGDEKPSCSVNVASGAFKCHAAGCGKGGDLLSLLSRVIGKSRALIFADLSQRYEFDAPSLIDASLVEKYHSQIWEALPLIKELEKRGVTLDLIRRYRLGEHRGRITIPVPNQHGYYVNIRRYAPGAPGDEKMKNVRGHGQPRLFPHDQLRYPKLVLAGGEVKALSCIPELNANNIGAVSATCGEGNWDPSFNDLLRGKEKVWVAYDIDQAGRAAAELICGAIYGDVKWVGNVAIPLDIDEFPHGGIDDYIAQKKGSILKLTQQTQEWKPSLKEEEELKPVDCKLLAAYSAEMSEKRVKLQAVVSAIADATYLLPAKAKVKCDKNYELCAACPIFLLKVDSITVKPESPAILEMAGAPKGNLRKAMMTAGRIPTGCPSAEFEVLEYMSAEEVRLSSRLEVTDRSADKSMLPAICVKPGLDSNECYEFVGKMLPHPRDQSATLLCSTYNAVGDALSSYKPSRTDRLEFFHPRDWTIEGLRSRLHEVYADFEANVTGIYQRRRLHLMMDLTWHSPLFFTFDSRLIKGYMELLVIGDSSQGKSDTAAGLMKHYQLGEKVECKNATVAGLLGGLAQLNGRWFVSWGIIPTHDKRLVVLEELKGASREVISKLTDMRSSGVAEIPKIEKRKAKARTRIVANSNPRGDRPMSSYNYGIDAMMELVGAPEDLRRFDAAIAVNSNEVSATEIGKLRADRMQVKPTHTHELCRELVLWSWTRDASQVKFERGAEALVVSYASKLCETFAEDVPLVDRGSMRYKLARVAAATAARTFSSQDGESLLVRECHADFAFDLLKTTYESPAVGYAEYSKAVNASRTMSDPAAIEKAVKTLPHAKEFVEHILNAAKFDQQDVQDWCGIDRADAGIVMSLLVRKKAALRLGRSYVKTPPFIEMLKRLSTEDLPDVPSFLEKEEF